MSEAINIVSGNVMRKAKNRVDTYKDEIKNIIDSTEQIYKKEYDNMINGFINEEKRSKQKKADLKTMREKFWKFKEIQEHNMTTQKEFSIKQHKVLEKQINLKEEETKRRRLDYLQNKSEKYQSMKKKMEEARQMSLVKIKEQRENFEIKRLNFDTKIDTKSKSNLINLFSY